MKSKEYAHKYLLELYDVLEIHGRGKRASKETFDRASLVLMTMISEVIRDYKESEDLKRMKWLNTKVKNSLKSNFT